MIIVNTQLAVVVSTEAQVLKAKDRLIAAGFVIEDDPSNPLEFKATLYQEIDDL